MIFSSACDEDAEKRECPQRDDGLTEKQRCCADVRVDSELRVTLRFLTAHDGVYYSLLSVSETSANSSVTSTSSLWSDLIQPLLTQTSPQNRNSIPR